MNAFIVCRQLRAAVQTAASASRDVSRAGSQSARLAPVLLWAEA